VTDKIAAVLWDMDGTLVDSEPLHEKALSASLLEQGITPPEHLNSIVVGMSAAMIHDLFCVRFGLRQSFQDWLVSYYGFYLHRASDLVAREGALEIFRDADHAGISQAIVSNSDRMLVDANLAAARITRPGLVSVARNDVRIGKPDPEPFLRAAWIMGVDPAQCVAVEDSVLGASAGVSAGMKTLFWPQNDADPPRGATLVSSAEELRAMLGLDHDATVQPVPKIA
jgi:beta-phosphoglucomutase-like phosphatase (HAD superfamily)